MADIYSLSSCLKNDVWFVTGLDLEEPCDIGILFDDESDGDEEHNFWGGMMITCPF